MIPSDEKTIPNDDSANPSWPEDIDVSTDFQEAFDLVQKGESFIFITGKAGTGKSTFIRALRQMTAKRSAVVAPTGVAALNAGGQTIHSFFRLKPGPINLDTITRIPRRRLYEKLELLIIDEISMVRADLLDAVEKFLRENGPDRNLPFGGVQIVAVGDLYQLPPVISSPEEARLFGEWYETEYFFSAHCLQRCPITAFELKKIYRQVDDEFIHLLNKVREGNDVERTIAELNRRCVRTQAPVPSTPKIPVIPGLVRGAGALLARRSTDTPQTAAATSPVPEAVTLASTNAIADRINEARLSAIPGDAVTYEGIVEGNFDISRNPPSPFALVLKVGAQVMFTKNDAMRRWVNGDIGRVTELGAETIRVELSERPDNMLDVERSTWESLRFSYDENLGRVNSEAAGRFTQFPLAPAWAVTIHKSQGRTIPSVKVDFGRGAFAHGQVYVALSRCRSLEGLVLERPLKPSDILTDERVKEFHARVLGRLFR